MFKIKETIKIKYLFCISAILISKYCLPQSQIGLSAGFASPITSYAKIVNNGYTVKLDYDFKSKTNFCLGINTQFQRFPNDKKKSDPYYDAKISIISVAFNTSYIFNRRNKINPYLGAGLGLSIFEVSYNASSTNIDAKQVTNASFTLKPSLGFNIRINKSVSPFLEAGLILLTDGPPQGFPLGDKLTGCSYLSLGCKYIFK